MADRSDQYHDVHVHCKAGAGGCKEKEAPCRAAALYVHVPFSHSKCRYCDFYSVPPEGDLPGHYVRAAVRELAGATGELQLPLASAYVGGGTPTALPLELLEELLRALQGLLGPASEFTVEANPGTLAGPVAERLAARGVNRVALGAQSFQQAELDTLGRAHGPEDIRLAVRALREAGIRNIGLDLIYGIPGQSPTSWRDSLTRALDLGVPHLSAYALSFEENTPLRRQLDQGRLAAMDEELQKLCYYTAIDLAGRAGLEHYEISNFARPGCRCRHNLTYWHNLPYLGIGPAAASYLRGCRRTNRPDLASYLQAVLNGQPAPCTSETLSGRPALAETLMLGLRLLEGVDRQVLARRFGVEPAEAFPRSIARHSRLGTLRVTPERIRLRPEWLFVADSVLADILAEAEG